MLESTFLPDRADTRERVRAALRSRASGGIEEFDATEVEGGWSLRRLYDAGIERVDQLLGDMHMLGRHNEKGEVVSIAGYKKDGETEDGRPIFEITKVSRLPDAKGNNYGLGAMDDAVEYLRKLYPDAVLTTASKTPGVIAHFRDLKWEEGAFGDDSKVSQIMSGKEPDDSNPQWKQEWLKMKRDGYINFLFDPKPAKISKPPI